MAIRFSSKSVEYGWLSNFSEHGITVDRVFWPSVEHFYQAQKYTDTAVADRIRLAESPLKARKIGQDRSLTPRSDWDDIKLEVMRKALLAKFEQNRRILEKLLETQEEELIHSSSSDHFWGRTDEGVGDNHLGKILMEVRIALRTAGATKKVNRRR